MGWAPDEELVVVITGASDLLILTKDFDVLSEIPTETDELVREPHAPVATISMRLEGGRW